MKKRIGIVVPGLEQGGGVPAVAEFLCQAIDRSDRYAAGVISVATSSQDPQSVRLLSPASWVQGVSAAEGSWRGRSYRHYGRLSPRSSSCATARDGYSPNSSTDTPSSK